MKNKFLQTRFAAVCPRKLNKLPNSLCILGSKTNDDFCAWYSCRAEDYFCFWNSLCNENLNIKNQLKILNISRTELQQIYSSAILKIQCRPNELHELQLLISENKKNYEQIFELRKDINSFDLDDDSEDIKYLINSLPIKE